MRSESGGTRDELDWVVGDAWSNSTARDFARSGATGLVLNYAQGFRGTDLSFLNGLKVARLTILARTIGNLEPIYSLAETLEELSIEVSNRAFLDLGRLPSLRQLAAGWKQVSQTITAASRLRHLFLLGYDEPTLMPLGSLRHLNSLVLKDRPSLASLEGLRSFSELHTLGIYLAANLVDLSDLQESSMKGLRSLTLQSCRGLSNLNFLTELPQLELVNAANCGEIESLAPIQRCHLLQTVHLYESTRVADADLSPLLALHKLTDLRIQSRREYKPTVAQVQASIAERH